MAQGAKRDRGKERFWRRMLWQWERSGQGVRPYCRQQGLSEPLFYAWRRTIALRDAEGAPAADGRPAFGPKKKPGPDGSRTAPLFVPVHVSPTVAPALEVVLDDGRVVRVPEGFDAATLRQLLAVLAETPLC